MDNSGQKTKVFTSYEVFVIAILAILQFTVILDFMVLSPLGALLLEELQIKTSEFGLVVSAYAFSAGASGLLAAGFADKFDRKKLLLFFYAGFIVGTALCAIANSHNFLLLARIVTGLFGGVIGSVGFAIITDLFRMEVRGRVMGFVQMAFAASQVLGIPIGLVLANRFGWHSPFWMIVGFSIVVALLIAVYMKPITEHIKVKSDKNPFEHLFKTISKPNYLLAFAATSLLSIGGFMLMPFSSAFSIHNLGLTMEQLPLLYGVTGIFSIIFGPLIGRLCDKLGKYKVFFVGSIASMVTVCIYNNMGITPLWMVMILSVCLFTGITARIISSSALMTGIPTLQDRGAFMSVNSSIQQIAGGIGSAIAGTIVVQSTPESKLEHYNTLGYVAVTAMIVNLLLMYFVNRAANQKPVIPAAPKAEGALSEV